MQIANSHAVVPVILCGGAGTRLWPLSRELYPKQLLPLIDEHSLLQNTVKRMNGQAGVSDPLIVCNEEHRFLVAQQLVETGVSPLSILLEPAGRNTAPAIALAALQLKAFSEQSRDSRSPDDDPVMVVLAADHVIPDQQAFDEALVHAVTLAQADYLVTFGVAPTMPETGYG
ncbi:MAG: sugar phosphate nucleotidyltransferase, partial [Gammaproteobacteria bacterium]|nr:sugar phosphate nucleotidyltransferase [Gammaproteobacteria bacterium]